MSNDKADNQMDVDVEAEADSELSSLEQLRLITEQTQLQLCKQKELIIQMEQLLEHLSAPPIIHVKGSGKDLHCVITECAEASMKSILNDSKITFGGLLLQAL